MQIDTLFEMDGQAITQGSGVSIVGPNGVVQPEVAIDGSDVSQLIQVGDGPALSSGSATIIVS